MLPVGVKVRVVGSYSNAELSQAFSFTPPVINTLPEFSRVAEWPTRAGASTMLGSASAWLPPRQAKRLSNKSRWNEFFMVKQWLWQRHSFLNVYREINVVNSFSKCSQVIRLVRALIFHYVRALAVFHA